MTILIKNIQLIDGTGQPPVKADILVKNNKISALGSFPNYRADEIIDGVGAYLSPGFIDIDTDSDHYLTLFDNSSQKDFLLQGVTTIIGGHCGASLAPLLYGSLESIREWTDINKINVNWHSLGEFFKVLEKKKIGVNFGTLVGHTTIRESLVGPSRSGRTKRDLSKNELKILNFILERSLKEGALGFSSGLGYLQARETSYNELKTLVSTTARYKGVYATHLRDEKENLISSVKETLKIAEETGAETLISHFRPLIGYEEDYDKALELLKSSQKNGIYFDIYPFSESIVLLQSFLPLWAQKEGKNSILKDIQSNAIRSKIIKELPALKGNNFTIISAPGNEYLVGKSLKQFSKNANTTIKKGLLSLMELTKFRAAVSYRNINFDKVLEFLKHDKAIIASNSASFKEERGLKKTIRPERSYCTFTKFLELAEKNKILPLEKAVYKITGLPAKFMKLNGRGIIREGYLADLVIFKDSQIREVILNGHRVVKDGEYNNELAGKILKRSDL